MGRSRRGFGRVRKLPSGRWQAFYADPEGRVRLSRNGNPTPVRWTAPNTFDTKADAEEWLSSERRLVSAGTWTPLDERKAAREALRARRDITLEEYSERWLQERRNSKGQPLAELTRDKYRTLLDLHILPTFGTSLLPTITRADVRAWHSTVAAGHPTTRAHAYNLLRSILATAVDEDEIIDRNPCYIRGAGMRHRSREVMPATLDELAIMVAAMPEGRRLALLLATWCALRSGELRELRRSDVDLKVGVIRVRRGVVRARTGREDGPRTEWRVRDPKTAAGSRDVAIPPHLIADVRAHLLRHAGKGADGFLFPSLKGGHLAHSTLYGRAATLDEDGKVIRSGHGWREARRKAGREDLDLHDLRHTGASMAGQAGASLAELMHRLGHSTPSMALHYQHATRERDTELARKLSAMAEAAE